MQHIRERVAKHDAGAAMAGDEMLLETGMGVDLHGGDVTRAATRAVEDAIRRVSLLFLRSLSRRQHVRVRVDIKIGVPSPDRVDTATVAAALPVGRANVVCEPGGLSITLDNGETVVMAVAAVVVRVEQDG